MQVQLPKLVKNFYFIFGVFFLVWMLFIDSNDVYSQFKLKNKLTTLEEEKSYYLAKIQEVKNDREAFSDPKLLEKFAREQYLMKKPSEDLYILVEE